MQKKVFVDEAVNFMLNCGGSDGDSSIGGLGILLRRDHWERNNLA